MSTTAEIERHEHRLDRAKKYVQEHDGAGDHWTRAEKEWRAGDRAGGPDHRGRCSCGAASSGRYYGPHEVVTWRAAHLRAQRR